MNVPLASFTMELATRTVTQLLSW